MFFTKERHLILESIFEQEDHFSADELHFETQKADKKVSRATIYRSLRQLRDAGILIEADFGHGHSHYELALGECNHIHLICQESGKVEEVVAPELEELLLKIAKKKNFKLKYHKIQLFGLSKEAL